MLPTIHGVHFFFFLPLLHSPLPTLSTARLPHPLGMGSVALQVVTSIQPLCA